MKQNYIQSDFNSYYQYGPNSFDHALNNIMHDKKIYAYPVLVTNQFNEVINACPLSINEGVYLKNDIIRTETNSPMQIKHSLFCSGYTRFFTTYDVYERADIKYKFYNRIASHLLYNFFTELAYPIPFDAFKIVKEFEAGHTALIQEKAYQHCKQNLIDEKDIVGFVCCEMTTFDNRIESILYVLTYSPINRDRSTCFELYDQNIPLDSLETLDSKWLKRRSSRILILSFIYEMQKSAGLKPASCNLYVKDINFLRHHMDHNYNAMNNLQKDICAYIFPEYYQLTNQEIVQECWLRYYVMNFGAIVRNMGLTLAGIMHIISEDYTNQANKVIKVIEKRMSFFLDSKIDYQIDAILVLTVINIVSNGSLKNITGIWAFYHLVNLLKSDNSNLIRNMLLLIYYNNQELFINLIKQIKTTRYLLIEDIKTYSGIKSSETTGTWEYHSDAECYVELLYEYSNDGEKYELNDSEKEFFSKPFFHQLDMTCIKNFFNQYPSVHHTARSIEYERKFYRNQLEDLISERIRNKDYTFNDITTII